MAVAKAVISRFNDQNATIDVNGNITITFAGVILNPADTFAEPVEASITITPTDTQAIIDNKVTTAVVNYAAAQSITIARTDVKCDYQFRAGN